MNAYFPFSDFLMNEWFNKLKESNLSFGFVFKQLSTKSCNYLETPFTVGGGFDTIKYIAFKWGILKYGGSPSMSSYATIPKDQISTF